MTTPAEPSWRERIAILKRQADACERQQSALRQRWVAYWKEVDRLCTEAQAAGLLPGEYRTPPFPEELRGLACGARTKGSRAPCQLTSLYGNGRCKYHGGLSTGPTSDAGRQQSRENGKKGGRPRRTQPHEDTRKVEA